MYVIDPVVHSLGDKEPSLDYASGVAGGVTRHCLLLRYICVRHPANVCRQFITRKEAITTTSIIIVWC